MIRRGHCQFRFAAELVLVIDERLVLSGEEELADLTFERDRPIVRLRCVPSPSISMRIMDDVAAPQNENAFVSQGRQAFADFIMERRRLRFINAELNYWDISLRIDVAQNRPSTVVETPAVVAAHRHRCKQFLDARSEVGITGRGILHPIQFARKAAEVVDRPRRRAHG